MSTAPTYKAFRAFALARGWTPKDLAPFVQADVPEQTAARILSHLAGVQSSKTGFSWDDCPLP
jgi:flagellar motor switch protein FliG